MTRENKNPNYIMRKKPNYMILLIGMFLILSILSAIFLQRRQNTRMLPFPMPASMPSLPSMEVSAPILLPINIETKPYGDVFHQVGVLSNPETSDILPLIGKRLHSGSNSKYDYYTLGGQNNMLSKIPIQFKGKSCSQGNCEEIFNGDNVLSEVHGNIMSATIYENDTLRYLPY